MNQLAIDYSRSLGEAGMARALEAERDAWIVQALVALRRFSLLPAWREFKTEDFRAWYVEQGLPEPHDHHVWGALTNLAANDGLIRFTGNYRLAVSPKTHGHPVKVWAAA